MYCRSYQPNKIFQNLRVVEFPFSFVDISSEVELDVGVNLNTSAYMMTYHNGQFMKFKDAQEVSPAHKAFEVHQTGDQFIRIRYSPTKSCVAWTRVKKDLDNKFICDLRFIKVDGTPCCSNLRHAEVARIYLCGQYEYCKVSHSPLTLDFGDLTIGQHLSRYIELRNNSTLPVVLSKDPQPIAAHHIMPSKLTIPPNSKKQMQITIKPTCLKVENILKLNIRNASNMLSEAEENFIPYEIPIKVNVLYNKKPSMICRVADSLKQIYYKERTYTYMEDEIDKCNEKRKIAHEFLQKAKRPLPVSKRLEIKQRCNSTMSLHEILQGGCEPETQKLAMYALLDVSLEPHTLEFGKIALKTYGMKKLAIKNNTTQEIVINLLKDRRISYTDITMKSISLKILPNTRQQIDIFCLGNDVGYSLNTFKYSINKIYLREHHYSLQAENPSLELAENNYKLGMVNPDTFITATSIRLKNKYNVTVNFEWDDLPPDAPFSIMPKCGSVPKHSTRLCNILYICKQTRKLNTVVNFRSFTNQDNWNCNDSYKVVLPVEVQVITRKLAVKFLEPPAQFVDIPLNLETSLQAKLENCSKEFAAFYVVEPLIKGFQVEPKFGIIRPKMLTLITVTAKLPCIMEFNLEITFKLNCRENVCLSMSGNVLEPKVVIHPRIMYLPRIPSNLLTYVPVTIQNLSPIKTLIDILEPEEESCNKMFELYGAYGNEKHKISQFYLDGNQSKTIFVSICEEYRREFEFYLPIQVNRILGPPNVETGLTDIQHYTKTHSYQYENLAPQIKLMNIRKEIAFCQVIGVITVPWLKFSQDSFEIVYNPISDNKIEFTMTNVSRRLLYIIVSTGKLGPNFTLYVVKDDYEQTSTSNHFAFELDVRECVICTVKFHPKGHGTFTTSAPIFIDNCMGSPYSNLTFIGRRNIAKMVADTHRVVFPPCALGSVIQHCISLKLEGQADKPSFFCESRDDKYLEIKFMDETVETIENDETFTILDVHITVCCNVPYSRVMLLNFCNENGAACEVEIGFCFMQCPLTLHVNNKVLYSSNTYPFYPTKDHKVYEYMENTLEFLEKWMFIQGYRRDFFPTIPESYYALSLKTAAAVSAKKSSVGNFSTFIKRLAGPLIKYTRRANVSGLDEVFRHVLEVYDSYEEVIKLLKARSCHLWVIQARFLLNFEQFTIYCNNVTSKTNADIMLTRELLEDPESYYRLSKLAWMEFIIQCYRAFVLNCCFLDCACLKSKQRDVLKVLLAWYNKHIAEQHFHLRGKNKAIKTITNITTDLSDGVAVISVLLHYCPFMVKHFKSFAEVEGSNEAEACIINNACLIDEALKYVRVLFPLSYTDFLSPNFVPMLFLSIHLFVVLPMFYPRDIIRFRPPLLRSSARLVTVYSTTQESLTSSLFMLNNKKNGFTAEKAHSNEYKKAYVKVKYTANYVDNDHAILIVQGTSKSRIFDTYILFLLEGQTGPLISLKKCKVSGQIYRPNKVEISVMSPFSITATFNVSITDKEPRTTPVDFGTDTTRKFYCRRLNSLQKRVILNAAQKGLTDDENVFKLYMQMVCLNSRQLTHYIWFRSDIGEFFIKVVSQARWDVPVDTLHASVNNWPLQPCNCGETCKCYRSTVVTVPHRNDMATKALRYALIEHTTPEMMAVFDRLINFETGRGILAMLLEDGGTDVKMMAHILREQTVYKLSSRSLALQNNLVTLQIHSDNLLLLPITLPADDKNDKFTFCMTSQCGMDMRIYRVQCFVESPPTSEEQIAEHAKVSEMVAIAEVCSGEDSSSTY